MAECVRSRLDHTAEDILRFTRSTNPGQRRTSPHERVQPSRPEVQLAIRAVLSASSPDCAADVSSLVLQLDRGFPLYPWLLRLRHAWPRPWLPSAAGASQLP